MAKREISNFFLVKFGSLAIKVIAFWEILPLALLHTQKLCLMYGQTRNFYYFPHWFGTLAVNARAFSKISLIPHQKSAICLNCQIKFVKSNHLPPSPTVCVTVCYTDR